MSQGDNLKSYAMGLVINNMDNEKQQAKHFGLCRCYTFFGVEAQVYRIDDATHPYPWRFRIKLNEGHWKYFVGIQNQCESKQSAIMRAKARCKWIADGTFDSRYV